MTQKSIICITILLSLFCCVYSQDINVSFQNLMTYNKWRLSNKRNYINEEESIFRQVVFFENLKAVNTHNSNPNKTYTTGLNQFSDMTEEEFEAKVLNNKISEFDHGFASSSSHEGFQASDSFQQAPSIDWRTKGAVTPIKNQGQCGSCWAFTSIAMMESINFINNGIASDLSEQQLLDCAIADNGFFSYGCSGGDPYQAYRYAIKFGIVNENQYPYVGKQGQCKVTSPTNGFKPSKLQRIKQTDNDLKIALNINPIGVKVNAAKWGSYKSGVFNDCEEKLNHGVLVVGYDIQGNWIVKNSWGTGWGENGFMRISAGNNCGLLKFAYTLIV